jgi:hypothetical protein
MDKCIAEPLWDQEGKLTKETAGISCVLIHLHLMLFGKRGWESDLESPNRVVMGFKRKYRSQGIQRKIIKSYSENMKSILEIWNFTDPGALLTHQDFGSFFIDS